MGNWIHCEWVVGRGGSFIADSGKKIDLKHTNSRDSRNQIALSCLNRLMRFSVLSESCKFNQTDFSVSSTVRPLEKTFGILNRKDRRRIGVPNNFHMKNERSYSNFQTLWINLIKILKTIYGFIFRAAFSGELNSTKVKHFLFITVFFINVFGISKFQKC